MKQTYIDQLKDLIGQEVILKGWLYNIRSSGKLVFLQLRDGSGIVQCVVFKRNDEAVFEKAKALGVIPAIEQPLFLDERRVRV